VTESVRGRQLVTASSSLKYSKSIVLFDPHTQCNPGSATSGVLYLLKSPVGQRLQHNHAEQDAVGNHETAGSRYL